MLRCGMRNSHRSLVGIRVDRYSSPAKKGAFPLWWRCCPAPGPAAARGGRGAVEAGQGRHDQGGSGGPGRHRRSEEHTSELQSLMRISYAVFCLKKKKSDLLVTNKKNINRT